MDPRPTLRRRRRRVAICRRAAYCHRRRRRRVTTTNDDDSGGADGGGHATAPSTAAAGCGNDDSGEPQPAADFCSSRSSRGRLTDNEYCHNADKCWQNVVADRRLPGHLSIHRRKRKVRPGNVFSRSAAAKSTIDRSASESSQAIPTTVELCCIDRSLLTDSSQLVTGNNSYHQDRLIIQRSQSDRWATYSAEDDSRAHWSQQADSNSAIRSSRQWLQVVSRDWSHTVALPYIDIRWFPSRYNVLSSDQLSVRDRLLSGVKLSMPPVSQFPSLIRCKSLSKRVDSNAPKNIFVSSPLPSSLSALFRTLVSVPIWRRTRHNAKGRPTSLQYFFLFQFLSFLASCVYASSTFAPAASSAERTSAVAANPFSRHERQPFGSERQVCEVWNAHSPEELCSKGRWARLRLMREMLLFSRDCDSPGANLHLNELFRLDWRTIRTEADLFAQTEHLRPGADGRDCVLGSLHSGKCRACFQRVATSMAQLDTAYATFERTLRRFDCLLAVDSNSATRPFSPNGTCVDCKIWYRKWLLVELVRVWRQPPCINWCYYTQLACPHFGTSKVVDFAGHPAFMCRDLNIAQITTGSAVDGGDGYASEEDGAQSCDCVHPCDLQRDGQPSETMRTQLAAARARGQPSFADRPYDFYASVEHCWARRRRCRVQWVGGVGRETAARFDATVTRQTVGDDSADGQQQLIDT